MIFRYFLAALAAYLLGSVSSSVILSKKRFGRDVRDAGSGNAGATNMARVFGMGSGLLVLACDAAKMALSLWLGWLLAGRTGTCIAGILCNVGHCWPVFFGFAGGKGVSVGAAVAVFLGWRVFLCCAAVFFLLFCLTHIVSVCSMAAAVLMPAACLIFGSPAPDTVLACSVAMIVVWRHRSNIRRLLKNEEGRFTPKK